MEIRDQPRTDPGGPEYVLINEMDQFGQVGQVGCVFLTFAWKGIKAMLLIWSS